MLELAAQGGAGIPIPGHGTKQSGLVMGIGRSGWWWTGWS